MPVISPVVASAVAIAVLLLVHVPPVTPSLSVMILPWHTLELPIMAVGVGLTEKVVVTTQPSV